MYECECCGCRFDEPSLHREPVEYWGRMTYEEVEGCPRCGGCYIQIKEDNEHEVDFY